MFNKLLKKNSGSAVFGNTQDIHWPGQSDSSVKGRLFAEFSILEAWVIAKYGNVIANIYFWSNKLSGS